MNTWIDKVFTKLNIPLNGKDGNVDDLDKVLLIGELNVFFEKARGLGIISQEVIEIVRVYVDEFEIALNDRIKKGE